MDLLVLLVFARKRPPAALKLGESGSCEARGERQLCILCNLANQRPPFRRRLLLPAAVDQSASSIQGNLGIQGKRETGEKTRSR